MEPLVDQRGRDALTQLQIAPFLDFPDVLVVVLNHLVEDRGIISSFKRIERSHDILLGLLECPILGKVLLLGRLLYLSGSGENWLALQDLHRPELVEVMVRAYFIGLV